MIFIFGSLVCTLVVVGACAIGFLVRMRAAVYSYDVTKGYAYNFEGTDAVVEQLGMNGGRVCLPPIAEAGDTAFLKVNVKASFLGRYVQPRVEVRSSDQSEQQFFERGARGIRYFNISSFIGSDPVEVFLEGRHIGFEGTVDLVHFNNGIPRNPTVLVIAPHPDDAEIAAYGFYSEIESSYIVTITAGDAGNSNYDKLFESEAEHFLKKGEQRTWESITVPMLCGIPPERTINLGFFDGTLHEMYANKEKDVCGLHTKVADINIFRKQNMSSLASGLDGSANWNSLVKNLERLLAEINPDIIVTPHPTLDWLETHHFSTIATLEAIKNVGMKDGRIFMYANHYEYNHLIPYGPVGAAVSLPPALYDDTFFSSIYSHTLSPEKQRDKIFSLEAMGDLRLGTNWWMTAGTTLTALKIPFKNALGFDESYYRRAVRRHELFFVVEFEAVQDKEKLALLVGSEYKNSDRTNGDAD